MAAIAPFLAVVEVEVGDEVQRYSIPAGQVWSSLLAAVRARPQDGFELDWRGGEMPGSERGLEIDQSNTSSVLDERLVLKCYRRLWPGAHPEAELVEQLTQRTPVVPAFRGLLSLRDPDGTVWPVALVQDYIAGARDGWEWSQELLGRALAGAPFGETTAFARPLGRAIAQLHAALAQLGGRPAAVDDARRWHAESLAQLERALAAVDSDTAKAVRRVESRIRADLGLFAGTGTLTRVHGDLHVGQVLFSPAGLHVIDFEGEPTRPPAERRALQSPVRDVASMLRSFDHVPRWVLRDVVDAGRSPCGRGLGRAGACRFPRRLRGACISPRPDAAPGVRGREGDVRARLRGEFPARMDADRFGLATRACGMLGAVSSPELFHADTPAESKTLGRLQLGREGSPQPHLLQRGLLVCTRDGGRGHGRRRYIVVTAASSYRKSANEQHRRDRKESISRQIQTPLRSAHRRWANEADPIRGVLSVAKRHYGPFQ